MSEKPHVVVVGMMGVGKSTVGRALASETGRRYVDSDDDISRLFGMSGAEYAQKYDIAQLHDVEAAVLLGALASDRPLVITAAASVVERQHVRVALQRRSTVVLLVASLEQILARQQHDDHRRPMEMTELDALWRRRKPLFEQVADLQLSAEQTPTKLVDDIIIYLPT